MTRQTTDTRVRVRTVRFAWFDSVRDAVLVELDDGTSRYVESSTFYDFDKLQKVFGPIACLPENWHGQALGLVVQLHTGGAR
ncbi:MAG: hypothetical protein KDA61_01260 [Planctomycetales bacterium]|nr:hypothetical protein [Planctomycetales bacterium]